MTWVLGSATIFGYAALIADIQVSWPERGEQRNILQKIHHVGPILLAGFSGSVRLGFAMIYDMQRYFAIPANHAWHPRIAAWQWHRRGRRIFAHANAQEKMRGCSLLLAGVGPYRQEGQPFFPAHLITMRQPAFVPEFHVASRWVSIGKGAGLDEARRLEMFDWDAFATLAKAEGIHFGGMAQTLRSNLATLLDERPVPGISQPLQVGLASIEGVSVQPPQGVVERLEGWNRTGEISPIARTWSEYRAMVREAGLDEADAEAGS